MMKLGRDKGGKEGLPHPLVLAAGDLLQEVGDALARRQREAAAVEEGHHALALAKVHDVACSAAQHPAACQAPISW